MLVKELQSGKLIRSLNLFNHCVANSTGFGTEFLRQKEQGSRTLNDTRHFIDVISLILPV